MQWEEEMMEAAVFYQEQADGLGEGFLNDVEPGWAKRSLSIRMALIAGHCAGLSELRPLVERQIKRRVPINQRWARGAVCILPGHRGSGICVA